MAVCVHSIVLILIAGLLLFVFFKPICLVECPEWMFEGRTFLVEINLEAALCVCVLLTFLWNLYCCWVELQFGDKLQKRVNRFLFVRKYGINLKKYEIDGLERRKKPGEYSFHLDMKMGARGTLCLPDFVVEFRNIHEMMHCISTLRNAGVPIPQNEYETAAEKLCEILQVSELPKEVILVKYKKSESKMSENFVIGRYGFCRHRYLIGDYLVYAEWREEDEEQSIKNLAQAGICMVDELP